MMPVNNKENRLGKKAFHKSIDLVQRNDQQGNSIPNSGPNSAGKQILAPSQNQYYAPPEQVPQQQNQPCHTEESADKAGGKKMLNRQNSYNSIDNNSRRYSLFSKTSFATQNSFLFGTRVFNRSQQQKPVPKVNIQNIFKNKANMYLDEDLAHTFDDLLDKGYDVVTKQKEEKEFLKQAELSMAQENEELQKEITPIYNQINKNQEALSHNMEIKQNYENQIEELQEEMESLQQQISQRVEEIAKQHNQFTQQIKDLEGQNNDIRSEININKAEHRQQVNQYDKTIKQLNIQQASLVTELTDKKKRYDDHKLSQATRLRKMENKCKMYLGILKH